MRTFLAVLLCLLAPAAFAQTLPAGCTGTAQQMSCTWTVTELVTATDGVHVLSFDIRTSNGVARGRIAISKVTATLSNATADDASGKVTFTVASPGGIQALENQTWDGGAITVK